MTEPSAHDEAITEALAVTANPYFRWAPFRTLRSLVKDLRAQLVARGLEIAEIGAREKTLRDAAEVARKKWPRGSAHTYASENADRYIALEDASETIADAILNLITATKEKVDGH